MATQTPRENQDNLDTDHKNQRQQGKKQPASNQGPKEKKKNQGESDEKSPEKAPANRVGRTK